MNKDKVYLKGYVIGRAADTLGYHGLMVQLENLDIVEIDKNLVHKEIGESQKPVVPQIVADWIEKCKVIKKFKASLAYALNSEVWSENSLSNECIDWLYNANNQETFARAWLDGYEVEEEKIYTVKVKAFLGQYLGRYYVNNEELTPQFTRTQFTGKEKLPTFTQKELESTGFRWVFDCPGIEIEEVENE